MKISIAHNRPSSDELVQVLNRKFGPRYSFRLFGLGENKTIMARKSAAVGVQLSFYDDQLILQRTAPSIAGSVLTFMMLTELVVFLIIPLLILFEGFRKDPYKEMAQEIGFFLKEMYPPEGLADRA